MLNVRAESGDSNKGTRITLFNSTVISTGVGEVNKKLDENKSITGREIVKTIIYSLVPVSQY